MYHAIGGLLFGMEKQRGRAARSDAYTTYQPWENKTCYEGNLKFETGGKIFYLERGFYHTEKFARLVCETDGEELSVQDGDLEMLLGEMNADLYFNTAAVGQLKMKPQEIVYSYLKNYIAGVSEESRNSTDVVKALRILDDKKKLLEQQKKQHLNKIREQISKVETGLEIIAKESADCLQQMEVLKQQEQQMEREKKEEKKGFAAKLLHLLKKIFFRKRLQREMQEKRDVKLKLEE